MIIGQGIAGTLLCHALTRRGKDVVVIDADHPFNASRVAAGIINPVTGRRFVKSWLIDQLLPVAKHIYGDLERLLNIKFLTDREIVRPFYSEQMEEAWLMRTADPGYLDFIAPEIRENRANVFKPFRYGLVRQGLQVDLDKLLNMYRQTLEGQGAIVAETLHHQDLEIRSDHIRYGPVGAGAAIFCEGAGIRKNPWFGFLPVVRNKGEALIVRIHGLHTDKLIRHKVFVVPLGHEHFWIGSTYERNATDPDPSKRARMDLTGRLDQCLRVPYQVIDHRAAFRPTVKDRKPLLGTHPEYRLLHVFNGLGTKGASLAPYFSEMMADYLTGSTKIIPEADIRRFV